jgi:hypothetical protein
MEITFQDLSQMLLSQHDHVIQALASDGAHQPFGKGVLPRALRCGQDFGDAHVTEAIPETFTVDLVPVSDQVAWRSVFGERFQDLLSGPSCRRMPGHVEINTLRRRWAKTTKTNKTRKVAVGTVKKSMETNSFT